MVEEGPIVGTIWSRYLDDDGDAYFYNHETADTQWDMPTDVASLESAEAAGVSAAWYTTESVWTDSLSQGSIAEQEPAPALAPVPVPEPALGLPVPGEEDMFVCEGDCGFGAHIPAPLASARR
jgi:hypothetical protein